MQYQTKIRSTGRARRRWVVAAVVGVGVTLAACSSSSADSTSAKVESTLRALATKASGSSGLTYSATYRVTTSEQSETITFAQDPPRHVLLTSTTSIYSNASTIVQCRKGSIKLVCTTFPFSASNLLVRLTDNYAPSGLSTALGVLKRGSDVTTSSATHGGLPSTCITADNTSFGSQTTYCVADSIGILTYIGGPSTTVALTHYSTNPAASVFSPPAGSTVLPIQPGT
ncbi:MAG TPA: hypothetical protein VHW93_01820 [Acidimicrobiales bacterium]|jgi:hypothetical protein|nr:hypothetical protein [Acidimicrobiales bacterium]